MANLDKSRFVRLVHVLSFLANDVTLVTSYGYCQSLKINDRRIYDRLSDGL